MNKMATEPMTATAAPAKVRRKVKLPAGKSALRTVLMLIVPALLVWVAVITTGRLLAYTCSRLTVDTLCQ